MHDAFCKICKFIQAAYIFKTSTTENSLAWLFRKLESISSYAPTLYALVPFKAQLMVHNRVAIEQILRQRK